MPPASGERAFAQPMGTLVVKACRMCMSEHTEPPRASALDIGQATDVGRVREANEDALIVLGPNADGDILVAVADGMGGHKAGEVASALAVDALRQWLDTTTRQTAAAEVLGQAVERGNATIFQA